MDVKMAKVHSSSAALPAFLEEEEEGKKKLAVKKKRLQRFSDWFARKDVTIPPTSPKQEDMSLNQEEGDGSLEAGIIRRFSRRVVTELPRPGTFRRQLSERREHLTPHQPGVDESRAVSVERRRAVSAPRSTPLPPPPQPPRLPELPSFSTQLLGDDARGPPEAPPEAAVDALQWDESLQQQRRAAATNELLEGFDEPEDDPPPPFSPLLSDAGWASSEGVDEVTLNEELEKRWILNLSMHFRDRSDREKFFVTYAQTPSRWRRLTVSCDYRNAPLDSLERDLKGLRYQRDKSARIFEAIRDSLPEIQFYDTVTNLKLETGDDDRLHVHVTEDVNEIITYPSSSILTVLGCPTYKESAVIFDSHLSGFVYKVKIDGQIWIKKEIPGPDAVDEFLYELQALHTLRGSDSVISFGGAVVDEDERRIKGLLLGFAERGALVDILYDEKGRIPWSRRERWAQQIVQGLNEIHEAGFVQGDLTLSNVVVDGNDDAKIIDINRRGCPVGWEPPELKALIANRLKVGMFIGVKSDLFQLGMVLWALATQNDEPELQKRPLTLALPIPKWSSEVTNGDAEGGVPLQPPEWFVRMVQVCLSEKPQDRLPAKDLLKMSPLSWRPQHQGRETLSAFEQLYQEQVALGTNDLPVEAGVGHSVDFENAGVVMESSCASSQVLGAADDDPILDPRSRYLDGQDEERRYCDSASSISTDYGQERERVYINAAPSIDTGYESSTTWIVPRGRKGARDSDGHGRDDVFGSDAVDAVYCNGRSDTGYESDYFIRSANGHDDQSPAGHAVASLDRTGHIVCSPTDVKGHWEHRDSRHAGSADSHGIDSSKEHGDTGVDHLPDRVSADGHINSDVITDGGHDIAEPHHDYPIKAVPGGELPIGDGDGSHGAADRNGPEKTSASEDAQPMGYGPAMRSEAETRRSSDGAHTTADELVDRPRDRTDAAPVDVPIASPGVASDDDVRTKGDHLVHAGSDSKG